MTKTPPAYNLHTPVIFRMVDGECWAIFPTLISDAAYADKVCKAYKSNGDYVHCPLDIGTRHRRATREEYMPLKKELKKLGYRLKVVRKIACSHHNERMSSFKLQQSA